MNIHRIINQCHRLSRQLLLTAVALTLLTACDKQAEYTPLFTDTTYEPIEFRFPAGATYQVMLNGIEIKNWRGYADPLSPLAVEISSDGQVLFSEELTIPEDRIFVFSEVLGHGLMNISTDQLHLLRVSLPDAYADATILLKGLAGHPNGIAVINNTEYFLLPADIASAQLSIEVTRDSQLLWHKELSSDATISIFPLMEIDGKLIMLPAPTDEQKAKLVNDLDTYVSFMYSSEDYPEHKSLVVEIAPPVDLVYEGRRPPTALKEGSTPITFTLEPDTPSEFQFIPDHEENKKGWSYLTIVRIYDPAKPDEPLQTLERTGVVYGFSGRGYIMKGEEGYKFRCYKIIPQSSPLFPERTKRLTDHYPLFMEALSFKLD